MRVLQVVHSYPPQAYGGTELYTFNLVTRLTKNHHVKVVTKNSASDKTADGDRVSRLNYKSNPSLRYQPFNQVAHQNFEQELDSFKPDIVHIQHLIGLSLDFIDAIKKRNIPYIISLHDYWWISHHHQLLSWDNHRVKHVKALASFAEDVTHFDRDLYDALKMGLYRDVVWTYAKRYSYMKNALSSAALVLAQSKFTQDKYYQVFSLTNLEMLPLGLEPFKALSKTKSSKLRFGYIGNLSKAKGSDILLQAFQKIVSPEVELHFYGKADKDIDTSSSDQRVSYHGQYDPSQLPVIFSKIDVLIVPSIWDETYSLVAREAYLGGVPVIASNSGALSELVIHQVNGLIFEERDSKDLSEKMTMVMNSRGMLDSFMVNAPLIPTMEDHTASIEAIYSSVL